MPGERGGFEVHTAPPERLGGNVVVLGPLRSAANADVLSTTVQLLLSEGIDVHSQLEALQAGCTQVEQSQAVHGPGYSLAHAAALLGLPGTLRLLLRSAGPAAAGAQAEGGYSPVLAAAASGPRAADSEEWALVPAGCPGLAGALRAALWSSPQQAQQLVARVPRSDAQRLRAAALCLARAQRAADAPLPVALLQHILCLAAGS
ncbi:4-hydroxy-3-methylbut-2-enyl diphosphate reductase [Micractinium conductrix]|uniref:4-hydroxy-3-methylbut-2-enyl diphosphate reductase n=1 Tax=Micractinium conductrix TaxID=554055 RepID=A0A2P6VHM9_9CHLO|nr:4-hydroxy-3-methylbut-2-enyl diphosphate reductase [Micractinium conductrix]|eukprot:PSC73592.1 4-hydroxy-3-methylbut-2-enyl diphosphate reductase [Micractinium conductrix]